jgi:hypothetical protein
MWFAEIQPGLPSAGTAGSAAKPSSRWRLSALQAPPTAAAAAAAQALLAICEARGLRLAHRIPQRLECLGLHTAHRIWISSSKGNAQEGTRSAEASAPAPVWITLAGRPAAAPYSPCGSMTSTRAEGKSALSSSSTIATRFDLPAPVEPTMDECRLTSVESCGVTRWARPPQLDIWPTPRSN